jgi:hypothetical protein
MKGIILCTVVLFSTLNVFSQILIGGSENKEDPKKGEKIKKVKAEGLESKQSDGSTSVYFSTNWSKTNRLLEPNGGLYGDSLGERVNEGSLNTWSFGLGMQNKLNKYLMWDGGIAISRNGESYNFTDTDTSYSYKTTYNYVGMPIRLNFTYGETFKFYAGAGLMPQMFTGYRQEREWTTSNNSSVKETFKTKSGYNPFVLSAIFNVGLILNFENNWALVVSPEARIQLTSSYAKLDGYIHKGRAYGVSFGLIRNL